MAKKLISSDNLVAEYLAPLVAEFEKAANPERAAPMSRYMKNRFPFLGIPTPARNEIIKQFFKTYGFPNREDLLLFIKACYAKPEREYHYFAITLAGKLVKKADPNYVEVIEFLVVKNSWWDSVDLVSSVCCRPFFKQHISLQKKVTRQWMYSDNLWLQRSAILFQLNYRNETNEELLYGYISELAESKEFFIAKAIGWALREYAKTNRKSVEQFLQSHTLQPLSRREAQKHF
jgi:3-methyladenine DNA glycosylase AlkD